MSLSEKIDVTRLPKHIAIIMDGNGRWANERGKERFYGHAEGVISVRKCTEAAAEIGIKYLTLYVFSTENWQRPSQEVDALMELLVDAIERETEDLHKNNIRLQAIGNLNRLPEKAREKLFKSIDKTKNNTKMSLVLALSYSSRWEITEAIKQIATLVKNGEVEPEEINDQLITDYLTTKNIPDPDLLIRTSGEIRISNYLLWQIAYSELYFTPTLWPDFREESLYEAILEYQKRNRRFGK